jgi:arginine/lysine/ornithine decarboxylase
LGADIVCDSAHKTLPVYTGGAYLHIAKKAPREFCQSAKAAMAMFGSTSPSYLILESLDMCSRLLSSSLPESIRRCCERVGVLKAMMKERGIKNLSAEPMKITVDAADFGYSGGELAELMRGDKMECEYSDPAVVVLMFSPYNSEEDYRRTEDFFRRLKKREPIYTERESALPRPEKAVSIREAMLAKSERIKTDLANGRICARSAMSCQPSVAVVMSGEKITPEIIKILKKYSIFEIDVL